MALEPVTPYWAADDYTFNVLSASSVQIVFGSCTVTPFSTPNNIQIEYKVHGSPTVTTVTKGSYASVTITGLSQYVLYDYRARPSDTVNGWGTWGSWKTFATATRVPGAIAAGWSIDAIDQTSARVVGITPPNNGGSPTYIVAELSLNSGFTGTLDTYTGGLDETFVDLPARQPATLYYVRLHGINTVGDGPDTTSVSFTTLPGVNVNIGGVWKNAMPYVNVAGVWKPATRYVNVGGVWKQ